MKIDYEALEQFLKENKAKLEAMSDKEYNAYMETVLEKFHK